MPSQSWNSLPLSTVIVWNIRRKLKLLNFLTFSATLSKWTVYKYINDGVFLRVTNKSLPMGGKRKTEYKKVQAARVPKGKEPFHRKMDPVLAAKEGGSKK